MALNLHVQWIYIGCNIRLNLKEIWLADIEYFVNSSSKGGVSQIFRFFDFSKSGEQRFACVGNKTHGLEREESVFSGTGT